MKIKNQISNLFQSGCYSHLGGSFSCTCNTWVKEGVCYHQAPYGSLGYEFENRSNVNKVILDAEMEKPTDIFLGPWNDFDMAFFAKVGLGKRFFVTDGRGEPATLVSVYVTLADGSCYKYEASCNENGEWKEEKFDLMGEKPKKESA